MAYPVETKITELFETANAIEITLPEHIEGDIVFVCVAQDGTATLTGPGAPWVVMNTGNSGGASRLVMYAVVGASPLETPTVTSNLLDGINAIAVSVRGASVINPIMGSNISALTGLTIVSPPVTVTEQNALMMAFIVEDQATRARFPADQLNILGQSLDGEVTNIVGYRVARNVGNAPAVSAGIKILSDTTQFFYVAVRDNGQGQLPPEIQNTYIELAPHGRTAVTWSDITTYVPPDTIIDGLTVKTCPSGLSTSIATIVNLEWDRFTYVGHATFASGAFATGLNLLVGGAHTIPLTNMLSGVMTVRFHRTVSSGTGAVSRNGWYLFLIDDQNRWAAYNYVKRADVESLGVRSFVFDFSKYAPVSTSSTPPDLTRIVNVGWGIHRLTSSTLTGRGTNITRLYFWPRDNQIGLSKGSAASPASMPTLGALFDQGNHVGLLMTQGTGQTLAKLPIRFGGSDDSFISFGAGSSTELAKKWYNQRIDEGSMQITVVASPSSFVDFSNATLGSGLRGAFTIGADSSPSASYSFVGAAFFGIDVNWKAGISCKGVNFFGCYEIDTAGAEFSECSFSGSLASADLITSNPTNIANCTFTQGAAGGHAIEITQPGTYSFVGNTFSGYGLDGTTDATIYNNSGGHVTLNVSGGGTPTVRNGSGASTTINSGVTLTFVGVRAGSEIHIFDGAGALLAGVENAEPNQQISIQATGVTVRIFIASLGFENIDLQFYVPSMDTSIPVFQRIDRNYRNSA